MPNMTVTSNDLNTPVLEAGEFRDELLTFTAAGTLVAGTLLARHSGGATPSNKLEPFVVGGAEGRGVPLAILTYDVTATAAGDEAIRAGVSGKFRKERLVIDADGSDVNITNNIIDQLRDYGLVPVNVDELNIADNS